MEPEPLGGCGAGPRVAAEHARDPGGVGVPGDLAGRGVLEDVAVLQDEDPVREGDGLHRVVGDDQADAAEAVEVGAQGVPDMCPGGLVERGQRLVEQQQPGPGGECPGQSDALGLAAGDLGRLAGAQVPDPEPVQPLLGPAAGLGARHALGTQSVGGVRECAEVREQRTVLRHPGDAAAVRGQGADVQLAELQRGVGARGESEQGAQQGRLARPVGSDDSDGGPGVGVERELVEAGDLGVQRPVVPAGLVPGLGLDVVRRGLPDVLGRDGGRLRRPVRADRRSPRSGCRSTARAAR